VNAAQVVPSADRDPVCALVAASPRAKDHVMFLKVSPRTTRGDPTAPAVAFMNRVWVARDRGPSLLCMEQHALKGPPRSLKGRTAPRKYVSDKRP
jgi:hypothetical protein